MSQVHPVFFRRLLTKAAVGEDGVGKAARGIRRQVALSKRGPGDSLFTPPVPADAWSIPSGVLRDADGLFNGSQQP